jgi:elongation factor P
MGVLGVYVDDKLFSIDLPPSVILAVSSTVPGIKGDSVSNMVKPATLETGIEINVPLFIKEGEKIRVDTRTGEYLERA